MNQIILVMGYKVTDAGFQKIDTMSMNVFLNCKNLNC